MILNPTLLPFIPDQLSSPPICAKEARCVYALIGSTTPNQKEATCSSPKADEEVWDGFGKAQGDADRQYADFVSLAQHVLSMVSPPPFDGFTYDWTWKGTEMSLGQATIFV
jgi:hypothetical protein